MNQDEVCAHCGYPCYLDHCEKHHIYKRSTHPHLKHDKRNLITLCPLCHRLTETDNSFLWWLQQKYGFLGDSETNGGGENDTTGGIGREEQDCGGAGTA